MNKFIFMFLFSTICCATDFSEEDFLKSLNAVQQNCSTDEIENILSRTGPKRVSERDDRSGKKARKSKENVSPECAIAEEDGELSYIDLNNEIVSTALQAVAQLEGNASYTRSYQFNTPALQEEAFAALGMQGLLGLVPVFREVARIITETCNQSGKSMFHLAIRVDPNAERMSKDMERRFTQGWHSHGNDAASDRYLLAITEHDNLTTMIRHKGRELYIKKNKLFLLPGQMEHRSPPNAQGKRVQISISIGSESDTQSN